MNKKIIQQKKKIVKVKRSKIAKINYYKRYQTEKLSQRYLKIARERNDSVYQKRAIDVNQCCDNIKYAQFSDGSQKILNMFSCKDRLHTACNYRRSVRTFAQLTQIINSDEFLKEDYKCIFLTLTLKSVSPKKLKNGIDEILYAFKKFMLNKRIKQTVKGFFRALEITFNPKTHKFHHHLHIIFIVNSSYFKKNYIKQSEFIDIWKKSAAIDYTPVVDVRPIKDFGGVAEVAKYSVSADDNLLDGLSDNELVILRDNLTNRRLVSMGGCVRDIARKLKLNLDDENLNEEITDNDLKNGFLKFIIFLKWNIGFGKYQIDKGYKFEPSVNPKEAVKDYDLGKCIKEPDEYNPLLEQHKKRLLLMDYNIYDDEQFD